LLSGILSTVDYLSQQIHRRPISLKHKGLLFIYCCSIYQVDCKIVYRDHFELFVYDTIRYKSLTWSRKLSIQLYLAHVARKRN